MESAKTINRFHRVLLVDYKLIIRPIVSSNTFQACLTSDTYECLADSSLHVSLLSVPDH